MKAEKIEKLKTIMAAIMAKMKYQRKLISEENSK